jgi:hypothetical protein
MQYESAFYEAKEFCASHKIGTTKFYQELKAGRLKAVKLGRKTLISRESAREWRLSLPALSASPSFTQR